MALPKKKDKRSANIQDALIFVYGEPGTGKTTLACGSEEPLLLHTPSAGHKVVTAYKQAIGNLDDLRSVLGELLEGKSDYTSIALDMMGDIVSMCEDEVIAEYNAKSSKKEAKVLADIPHGAGWSTLKNKVTRIMAALARVAGLPKSGPVVVTSHTKTKKFETTFPYDQVVPEFSDSVREKVMGMCDIVGLVYMNKEGNRRIKLKASKDHYAKNRLSGHEDIDCTWAALSNLDK
jgi:phage nucleotide-binding protein